MLPAGEPHLRTMTSMIQKGEATEVLWQGPRVGGTVWRQKNLIKPTVHAPVSTAPSDLFFFCGHMMLRVVEGSHMTPESGLLLKESKGAYFQKLCLWEYFCSVQ